MSFRFLQSLSSAVLIGALLIIGLVAYQHSQSTIKYITLIVEVHNPTNEKYNDIIHLLDKTDYRFNKYQNQFRLNSNAVSLINRQIIETSSSIDRLTLPNDGDGLLTPAKNLVRHMSELKESNSSEKNQSIIVSIDQSLFEIQKTASRVFQKAEISNQKNLRPLLLVISNLRTSINTLTTGISKESSIPLYLVLEPVKQIKTTLSEIVDIIRIEMQRYHSHDHTPDQNIHALHLQHKNKPNDEYSEILQELEFVIRTTKQLEQAIQQYSDEAARMDPSASQVVDGLELVSQIRDKLQAQIEKSHNLVREHNSEDQVELLSSSVKSQSAFVFILLVATFLAILGGLVISRFLRKDINVLIQGTKLFYQGDLKHRILASTLKEFQEIAKSFNEMATSIELKDSDLRNSMRELDAANNETLKAKRDLENQVEVRTKDLKEAMERAKESDRAKSLFLANMSHELRTPMHGILSFSEFGKQKVGHVPDDRILKYFNQISSSGDRLLALINDLLDLAKLEAGKIELHVEINSLSDLIQSCVDEQEARLKELNLTLKYVRNDKDNIKAEFDSPHIGQVITNLLSNAIKFSQNEGCIEIGCSHHDNDGEDWVMFYIRDDGLGIPDADLNKIFDKFSQSESTSNVIQKGTGLGLSISREIIQCHGGLIWAENNQDSGAVFKFIIPKKYSNNSL